MPTKIAITYAPELETPSGASIGGMIIQET